MEKPMLRFYALDNKMKVSLLEELRIAKFFKVSDGVEQAVASKSKDANQPNINYLKKYVAENYETHYFINTFVKDYIDDLYNNMIKAVEPSNQVVAKTKLMNTVRLETNRLLLLKKQFRSLGNSSIDPDYLNNLFNMYDLDKDCIMQIVFNNLHNELSKVYYEKALTNEIMDINNMAEKMLENYTIDDEIKNAIMEIYKTNEAVKTNKIVDLNQYKIRKLIKNNL